MNKNIFIPYVTLLLMMGFCFGAATVKQPTVYKSAVIDTVISTVTPTTTPTVIPTQPTVIPTSQPLVEGIQSVNYDGNVIFSEINQYRKVNDKSQLILKQDLCTFAYKRAKQSVNDWSHNGFFPMTKLYPQYPFMVENLSNNFTTHEVVTAWINSRTHKENLDAKIKYGCVRCYDRNCAFIGGK